MSGGQNLRVTHIVSGDLWAGAEVQCFQLLRSLAEDGAVSPRAIVLNEGELASRAAAAGIEVCVIPEARHTPVELYRRITRELRAQAPQLVHTHRGKENIIGSLAALWLSRAKPEVHEEYTVPVASGIIAGESLMGVLIALLVVAKVLG